MKLRRETEPLEKFYDVRISDIEEVLPEIKKWLEAKQNYQKDTTL